MGLSLAAPMALWGLLGLPVILGIHFLQSRNRREEVSTLFLLEILPEETRSGAVFTYIRNGLQLWLQLLAVLLFTLILARPMRIREESLQSVAVVVDSSVSMQAFPEEIRAECLRMADELENASATTEWWLLPSDPAYPAVLRAGTKEAFLAALDRRVHRSGPHSPRAALIRARQVAGPGGVVVYLTDHPAENLPADAVPVSVGHPLENSGFTGMNIRPDRWEATVYHFGSEPLSRSLSVVVDGQLLEQRDLQLEPGTVLPVGGALPDTFDKGELRFGTDGYAVDDHFPFVKPLYKPLQYSVELKDPASAGWVRKLMDLLPGSREQETGVLQWREGWPLTEKAGSAAEIWFLNGKATAPWATAVPGTDSLAEGLGWEGFLALPYTGFLLTPSDSVQLWMGEQPLVILRNTPTGERLLLNFDETGGNALRHPSFLLLLHRFVEEVREGQALPSRGQLETRQRMPASLRTEADDRIRFEALTGEVRLPENPMRSAPDEPGFLSVHREEERIFHAAVAPGDVAEGDFSRARPVLFPAEVVREVRERNSQQDFLLPLWFVLLAVLLTGSWIFGNRGGQG